MSRVEFGVNFALFQFLNIGTNTDMMGKIPTAKTEETSNQSCQKSRNLYKQSSFAYRLSNLYYTGKLPLKGEVKPKVLRAGNFTALCNNFLMQILRDAYPTTRNRRGREPFQLPSTPLIPIACRRSLTRIISLSLLLASSDNGINCIN
ncbi:hypothetical protein Zmor_002265 [Zophobas morio]|uniref:Uncharacterized protein n=1 Tax=Zophobas morio TaxID=2755281 RepID=A0AA38J437_9CUCU|nr:hypothetical protein Zmor_002265 [Zophobas morio]